MGYAGVHKDRWFYGAFLQEWQNLNIMTLEFYQIILALHLWGPLWKNHSILFFTNNEAVESVINKQTSRVNEVMRMVRYMALQCLNLNILFKLNIYQVNRIFWLTASLVCWSINFLSWQHMLKRNHTMRQASCCHRTSGVHWGLNTSCIGSLYSKHLQTCIDYF